LEGLLAVIGGGAANVLLGAVNNLGTLLLVFILNNSKTSASKRKGTKRSLTQTIISRGGTQSGLAGSRFSF
jgi:hypothetical protein